MNSTQIAEFNKGNYDIHFPDTVEHLDQDEEWFILSKGSTEKKIRLHEYDTQYKIPNLYEKLFYDLLECNSPTVVCRMLKEEVEKKDNDCGDLNVLDFGSGNGVVGEELKNTIGCKKLVGVDIIPEARDAAYRDRKDLYDDYYVMNLSQLSDAETEKLQHWKFNVLITVAALGFDDIPCQAFVNALSLLRDGSWLAFNIKDEFLSSDDESGFCNAIRKMLGDDVELLNQKRYCHRLSTKGEPIYYRAMVCRKKTVTQ
jgi:predicted TPR repeat methyltransferase